MSKEAYYFSHDANARHDPKILAMREDYGVKGYGVYWIIVEMLREQDEFKLPLKKYIWSAIAMQVQCKDYAKDDAKHFVEICINEYELFNSDGEYFWSNSLIKRMGKKNEVSEKRRAAANARWDKSNDTNDSVKNDMQNNANAMQMDANAMQVDAIKGKEKKGNKENKIKDINKPSNPKYEICDMYSANLLFDLMLKNNPSIKRPNLEKWAADIRKMREIDERPTEHIDYMIRWSQSDEFWKTNILSPSKLREKYDQLVIRAKSDHERKNRQINKPDKPLAFSSLEQWAMEGE
jgi:hypothetical protein